ncbi:DpnD/PcfM family protein [Pleomorphomonas sp. PLEO]|uniref:DpnD/PcfM family protein n=1 Tax=Pleomorphomonas sp. PLEO TaxID=3239306 RepID=UPI00351F1153
MAKFTITLTETVTYTVEVEAVSRDEAGADACEMWAQSENPTEDFNGIGNGLIVKSVMQR